MQKKVSMTMLKIKLYDKTTENPVDVTSTAEYKETTIFRLNTGNLLVTNNDISFTEDIRRGICIALKMEAMHQHMIVMEKNGGKI